MRGVSTHVLDITRGIPARDLEVHLERSENSGDWRMISSAYTGQDGRCSQLLAEGDLLPPGIYRLAFDTASYFSKHGMPTLYPQIEVTFSVVEGEDHYHIPLLLSPYGYSTYKGT